VGLRGRPHVFGNIAPAVENARRLSDFWGWIRDNGDASVTWEDIAWLRQHWDGPIVIKGILDAADALQAIEVGAEGIVVSNHGGRQLDGTCSSISALPSIVRAIEARVPVLIDGGIRNGVDVLKALALGADACLIGRPWAYALAAEGERGVTRLIGFFAEELRTAMALAGVDSVAGVDESLLRQVSFAD
jgi:L-lactate dehydrogenase (cytochrome)